MLNMEWKDIIMTAAVLIGLVVAVYITRMLDEERFQKNRKLEIFRMLMRERGIVSCGVAVPYSFVYAFNLIPVEFSKDKAIKQAWKNVQVSMCLADPAHGDVNGAMVLANNRLQKIAELLYEIAKNLGIKISPFDIQTNYTPKAWGKEQQDKAEVMSLLYTLLKNERSLKVELSSCENKNKKYISLIKTLNLTPARPRADGNFGYAKLTINSRSRNIHLAL